MAHDMIERFRSAIRAGQSRDEAIADMRRNGLSIIEAIKATRDLFGVPLGEAKQLVSQHSDWVDIASASAPLHEFLFKSCEEIATNKPE